MFDTYKEIFKKRGESYDLAMQKFPLARKQEFESLLDHIEFSENEIVVDIPSGGSYLTHYLPTFVKSIAVENCREFINKTDSPNNIILSEPDKIAIENNSIDVLLSLAGIHHMSDKRPFFNEIKRVLKPSGRFCIADVSENSAVHTFLDTIVHKYNSQGHHGDYLNEATLENIQSCGLTINNVMKKDLHWHFDEIDSAVEFCRLMFGLDNINLTQFKDEMIAVLGIENQLQGVSLHWQLMYITGNKPE